MYKLFLILVSFCTLVNFTIAQSSFVENEFIIMLKPKASISDIQEYFGHQEGVFIHQKTLSTNMNIHLVSSHTPTLLISQLSNHPAVLFTQKNTIIQWRQDPNDVLYDTQWALDTIDIKQAWSYTTGGLSPNNDTIVSAIIDGSFYINHEDLKDNIWHNHAEIPNNQIDDDQNGFVDDYNGWQLVYNNDKHDYGSISNHGTSILGIIGAKGNNGTGISGINWDAKLMLLSAHTAAEITKLSNVIEGYSYILEMRRKYNQTNGQEGAFVVATNSSWGIDYEFSDDHPIWCALYDSLGSVGILSVAATTNNDVNIDKKGDMPCSCNSEYLISVGESTREDQKDGGYGNNYVDLFAPAASKSTRWSDLYGDFGGTSGAAPHLTGSIALLYSYPNISWSAMIQHQPQNAALLVKSLLLNSVDRKVHFTKSVSKGRLNIGRPMKQLSEYFTVPDDIEILTIFPSPTNSLLTIKAALSYEGEHPVKVYNSLGQIVAIWYLENNAPTIRHWDIDVRSLPPGIYTLELETATKKYLGEFVKY